jgi:hypothetical protein
LENTTSLSLWFCNQKSCERTRCTLVGVAKKRTGRWFYRSSGRTRLLRDLSKKSRPTSSLS